MKKILRSRPLPCPDCGSKRLTSFWLGDTAAIGCRICGLIDGDALTRAIAVRNWNTKARPSMRTAAALVLGGAALLGGCAPAATDLRPVPPPSSAGALPPAYYARPYATPPLVNYPGVPRAFWPSASDDAVVLEDDTPRRLVARTPSERRRAAPQTEQHADVVAVELPASPRAAAKRPTQPAGIAPGDECGWHRLCNLPGWRYEN